MKIYHGLRQEGPLEDEEGEAVLAPEGCGVSGKFCVVVFPQRTWFLSPVVVSARWFSSFFWAAHAVKESFVS